MWPAFDPRPFSPDVILLELFRAGKQASALYGTEAWEIVREALSDENRDAAVQGLRTIATVATAMADSLEESPSNYGIQR
jgi:hypothetical protein